MNRLKKYAVPLMLILVIPQLANLLCCWMLSGKQLQEIPTAVYMGDNTAISRKIVGAFENHETFDITIYADSPDEIPTLIEAGKASFALIIPKHFTADILRGKAPNLMTVVDGSQLSAASFTKIAASQILLELKSELLQEELRSAFDMTKSQAESAASALVFQNRLLGNPTRNYLNFLMPGMMTAIVQVGLAMAAAASAEGEHKAAPLRDLGSRALIYTGLGFISLMGVLGIQTVLFKVPMKSGVLPVLLLSLLFSFAVSAAGILISAIFRNKVLASQAAAIAFIPSSILSGYTWPLNAMPVFYQKLAWFMPFTHYGDSLRDALLMENSRSIAGHLGFLLVAGIAALGIGTVTEMLRDKQAERGSIVADPA